MYYLLKNNIIIDTNNKTFKELYTGENGLIYYSIETPNETHCHYCLGGGEYEDNTYKFNNAQIKKQSENVFNLVEIGDCYLYQNQNMLRADMVLINDKVMLSIFGNRAIETPKCILAIYKPNSKGDYIKVWEVEDD